MCYNIGSGNREPETAQERAKRQVTRSARLMDVKGLKADEAVIVSKPSNMFYLSGYTGEGLALVSREICAIVTDFRYVEQAGQGSTILSDACAGRQGKPPWQGV